MDAYVAKVDQRTKRLLYLVRLGGEGVDIANRIILERRGFAYVVGFTGSRDFPVSAEALQRVCGGGDGDAFLAVIDPNGKVAYSTYFGGAQADQGDGIAWASNGDVLIAGTTWSSDLPFITATFGPRGNGDAFVARLKPTNPAIHDSVVVGGSRAEKLTGIVRFGERIYLTGYTESPDFPAEHAFQSRMKGTSDAFLTAVPEAFQSLLFSTNLLEMPAKDAVAAMRKGSISAEKYAQALLDQCERGNALNAFITLDRERVLTDARAADQRRKSGAKLGALHGLPIPVKDSVNTKDYPTTAGAAALRDFHPKEDAPIVRTLRNAGAIVMGKTNLHELSLGYTSENKAFGAVHNPYDPSRIPGGSSGGTATAVAARMAPLGVAEDTEGSIRVPAALCGIAGFRPTTSRYPSSGVAPITALFDQVGPQARSVSDLALFDAVATGDFNPLRPVSLRGLKLGVARGYWFAKLDSEVERVTNAALRRLQDAGVELLEAEVPDVAELIKRTTPLIVFYDILRSFPKYLQDSGAGLTLDQVVAAASPEIKEEFTQFARGGALFVSEETYTAARAVHLPRLRKNFADYYARTGVAAIVFPTTLTPALGIGTQDVEIGGKRISLGAAMSRNIAPGSTAGLPGQSVACNLG